ncbi:MAG: MmgE/PrpD family protein [Acetobacteraceae bacterium]|nr:MmgE/PrpD family protein [Acetobacteraceae bacterium]
MTEDPSFALARHATSTNFENLPAATVTATKRDILDTFGCILGGSGAPGIDDLFGMADYWGGREESTVLLRGRRLPAPQAALLNASMGHALDFDDTHDTAGSIHPGTSVLAAGLAVADTIGVVDGKRFILAIALGLDVSCRVALASTVDRGWHRTACMGVFGAAVTSGVLLGLNAAQMRHALGIAYSHAAGNRQCILDAALSKRLQAGQAASAGVFSAVLAGRNFTGAHNIFEGRYGFLELYQPNGADPSLLLKDLGIAFRGDGLSFKPYPCGRPLHAGIDAALAVRAQMGTAKIEAVTISLDRAAYIDQFENGTMTRRPAQVVQAQFALPFLVATALAHGRVGIADVAGLGDAATLTLSDRIEGAVVDATGKPRGWMTITARLTDGRTVTVEASDPIGSPEKPLSADLMRSKFRDNAANARLPIAAKDVEAALAVLEGLEGVEDVGTLTRRFS